MLASTVIACLVTVGAAAAPTSQKSSPQVPDVLVLALCGTGPTDQVSINYSSVVPTKRAMSDIKAVGKETGWFVGGEKVTTMSVSAGGGLKTTSGCFTTLSILDYKEGILPLEPFVNALKRFRSIEVNFLTPKRFQFRGLEEFENEFVKIHLIRGGGTYLYRVRIKDSNVEHITLPKRQPVEQPSRRRGMSGGARAAWAIAIAVACAAAAYLIAYMICRRRRTADGM